MTLNDLERRDARRPVFQPIYARTIWPTMIKFSTVTHVGRSVFVMGQAPSQLARPQGAPIFEVPATYVHNLWRRTTDFNAIYRERRFRVSATPPSQGARPSTPILGILLMPTWFDLEWPFWGGGILLQLCRWSEAERTNSVWRQILRRGVLWGQQCNAYCTKASRTSSVIAQFPVWDAV